MQRQWLVLINPGNTLPGLASYYGTTVEKFARWNELAETVPLVPGHNIGVPSEHPVQPGDTLSSLAITYQTTVEKLARVNRLADPNHIEVNQELIIPAMQDAPAATYPGTLILAATDISRAVFLLQPDGTGRQEVAIGTTPLFAPDGQRIAFVQRQGGAGPDGQHVLYVARRDGSQPEEYGRGTAMAACDLVRWSPRDRYIALLAGQELPGYVALCDLHSRQINWNNGVGEGPFDWTPDGNYAIWGRLANQEMPLKVDILYGDPEHRDTAVVLTQGQYPETTGWGYLFARISPDGATVAVCGETVFCVGIPGRQSPLAGRVLGGADPQRVAWSPDGRALAVQVGGIGEIPSSVNLIDVATGEITPLAGNATLGDWSRQ